ncbi:MAG: hypothetical protein HUK14_06255 [Muribaculaceae bacterium]|nr:hypothetical protein [Muribaculaceae bacterium]
MEKNETIYENAQGRISELIAEIGEQVKAVCSVTDGSKVNELIAEDEKADLIMKQAQLIDSYIQRDMNDIRDAHIKELNALFDKASSESKNYCDLWYKAHKDNKVLKQAVKSLTQSLNSLTQLLATD